MRNYVPNERIIDRAVSIWKKLLERPRYDNGDGGMAMGLAMLLPNNANAENLAAFGEHLKAALMVPDTRGHLTSYISVDYHPDPILADAAEKAGLKLEFPWKTTMHLNNDSVAIAVGYGRPLVYHYPLKDGRWLMTMLAGDDMPKVLEYVEGGTPTFEIE